jgi:hypothetical protein
VGDAQPAAAMLEELLQSGDTPSSEPKEIYGDSSYGTADLVEHIEAASAVANVKVQPPSAKAGMFSQDAFTIDTEAQTVRCPAGLQVALRQQKDGSGLAEFGQSCAVCPMRNQCTTSPSGRTVRTHPKHKTLSRARTHQRDASWKANYRATRPKVERKIAHMMRRKHGGRRARVRGRLRVAQDFSLLAAVVNLARLAAIGVTLGSAAA